MNMAEVRIMKDLEEVRAISSCKTFFPDKDCILHFVVQIIPQNGLYKNAKFNFDFKIPDDFPFTRPVVTAATRMWHPNVEETGAVCLNLLRESYTPALSISHLIAGLEFLMSSPNPHDPLNKEAADQMIKNNTAFESKAKEYILLYCPK